MHANSNSAFSGFSHHLANDFLHHAAIYPGRPSIDICNDPELFEELLIGIPCYLNQFTDKKFLNKCQHALDRKNPFEFNEDSNRHYMQS